MNRQTLLADVARWLSRDDIELGDADSVVRVTEARIARDVRALSQERVAVVTFSEDASGGYPAGIVSAPLPDGLVDIRSVSIMDSRRSYLNYKSPSVFISEVVRDATPFGFLYTYTIVGDRMLGSFGPNDIMITYFERFAPLVSGDDTNQLLVDAYDLYLNAALATAGAMLEDAELAQMHEGRYQQALVAYTRQQTRTRAFSGVRVSSFPRPPRDIV